MSVVNLEFRDDLAIVTVDNPPVNALSQAVRAGLVAALDEAKSAAALVLHCAGRTFFAGADIREFGRPPQAPFLTEVIARIEISPRPIIAALHGTALGGGLEVALACHYRVAAPTARMGLPEIHLGLIPGAGGTQRLPRLAGVERALDMMISGKPVDARTAAQAGIVDRIVGAGDLLEGAIEFAREQISGGNAPRRARDLDVPPVETGFFKEYRQRIAARTRGLMSPERIVRCVEASFRAPFDEALAQERAHFAECVASPQSRALRHLFFAEREAAKGPADIAAADPGGKIGQVAVIGAGTMGAGIAYACLGAGLAVVLLDNDDAGLVRGRTTVERLYDGGVVRGKVSREAADEGLRRLTATRDYADVAGADVVIEAVFENMDVKREVFARLARVCRPDAILATNTSTLDVDRIAAATGRPEQVIGLHFFSPAHIMRLIEVVRGAATAAAVVAASLALAKRLRKLGVVVGNGFGFVGNRMLYAYGRESQSLLLEGAAPESVDGALEDWGMAMGPHAVGDLAGLDVGSQVRRARTDLPDDPRFYRIADMLVEAGRLGRKTGRGMYRYESGSRTPLPDADVKALIAREAAALGVGRRSIGAEEIVERCVYALVVEGARILEEGIAARAGDIDAIWVNGYGFPRHRGGPMHYADEIGIDKVCRAVTALRDRFGAMYWEVPDLLQDLARRGGKFADL